MDTLAVTVRKDLKEFFTLSPQVKFLLAIQLIILFILSILIGVIFSPKFKKNVLHQTLPTTNTKPEQTGGVRLTLLPQDKFVKLGDELTYYVTMSGEPAYAVDTVIKFDPAVLAISNVENGDVFDRIILNELKPGMLTFSVAYDPGKNTFKKEGIVLKFKAKALKKSQETVLYFDIDHTIAAQDGKNILQVAEPATLHIFD